MGQYTYDYGNKGARFVAAFGESWPEEIKDEEGKKIPNPQTKAEFATEQADRMFEEKVKRYEQAMERNANQQIEKTNYENNDF